MKKVLLLLMVIFGLSGVIYAMKKRSLVLQDFEESLKTFKFGGSETDVYSSSDDEGEDPFDSFFTTHEEELVLLDAQKDYKIPDVSKLFCIKSLKDGLRVIGNRFLVSYGSKINKNDKIFVWRNRFLLCQAELVHLLEFFEQAAQDTSKLG